MERFFRWSLTFLLLLATIMECVQVLLRYVLHMPLMWLDETIIFPAIWMYMLGCANAPARIRRIVAKILPVFFPKPRPVAVFDFCARVFSLVISVWLTWHAVEYFSTAWKHTAKPAIFLCPCILVKQPLRLV